MSGTTEKHFPPHDSERIHEAFCFPPRLRFPRPVTHRQKKQEVIPMKRIMSIIVAIVLVCTAAIACADGVKVGIGQFAQHG